MINVIKAILCLVTHHQIKHMLFSDVHIAKNDATFTLRCLRNKDNEMLFRCEDNRSSFSDIVIEVRREVDTEIEKSQ